MEPITCTVNPEAGRERELKIAPAPRPRRVLVIGGGLAGLEAARVAALKGHRVTLYEEDGEVGGQWLMAARPPHKEEHAMLLDHLTWQLRKLGVECHLGQSRHLHRAGSRPRCGHRGYGGQAPGAGDRGD